LVVPARTINHAAAAAEVAAIACPIVGCITPPPARRRRDA
jgi:hypothetical protein